MERPIGIEPTPEPIPYEKAELNASVLRIKLSERDQLLECRWVEGQISPLSMKALAQFWSTSNLYLG